MRHRAILALLLLGALSGHAQIGQPGVRIINGTNAVTGFGKGGVNILSGQAGASSSVPANALLNDRTGAALLNDASGATLLNDNP